MGIVERMMGRVGVIMGGLALLLVAGAVISPIPVAAQFDGPEAEVVRATELAFAKTMADRDLEAFLSFIAPDAVFFNGSRPLRGIDAIEEDWGRMFEGDTPPLSWAPDVVQVMESGDMAISSGPVTGPDGQYQGRFNSVWRKKADGSWEVIFDKGSP